MIMKKDKKNRKKENQTEKHKTNKKKQKQKKKKITIKLKKKNGFVVARAHARRPFVKSMMRGGRGPERMREPPERPAGPAFLYFTVTKRGRGGARRRAVTTQNDMVRHNGANSWRGVCGVDLV